LSFNSGYRGERDSHEYNPVIGISFHKYKAVCGMGGWKIGAS